MPEPINLEFIGEQLNRVLRQQGEMRDEMKSLRADIATIREPVRQRGIRSFGDDARVRIVSFDKAGFSDKYRADAQKIAASADGMALSDVLQLESVEGWGWVRHRFATGSISINGYTIEDVATMPPRAV